MTKVSISFLREVGTKRRRECGGGVSSCVLFGRHWFTPPKGVCGPSPVVNPQKVKLRLRWMDLYRGIGCRPPESGVLTGEVWESVVSVQVRRF